MNQEQINTNENEENIIESEPKDDKKRKNLSVFFISALIHSILILLTLLIVVSTANKPADDIIVTTQVLPEKEEPFDEKEKRDVIKQNVEVEVKNDIDANPVVTNEDTTDHNETENNMEASTAEGTAEGISDYPQTGSGIMGNIGGGGGGGGTFGTRSGGGKKRALMRGGGSQKTESAVDAALRWLMRHQEKDGHWDRNKYGNDNDNSGFARNQLEGDTALTGLCVLAFLSAGHTPKVGKYKNVVRAGLEWMLTQQKPDGSFGNSKAYTIYDNSICALTLAEAAGMCSDSKIKTAAQSSLDFLANYSEANKFHKVINGKPNSVSVAGWMMMAFKSGKLAGLKIPEEVFKKYKERLDEVTEKDLSGNPMRTHYITIGDKNDNNLTMTCVGMLIYEYLGVHRTDLTAMADKIIKDLPTWNANHINNDFYKWYYATLALFQYGGEHWKKWNQSLSKMLVENQRKGGPLDGSLNDVDGSWDYEGDFWGKNLGRIYTTAMGAFCLEVYYRYESVLK